MSRLNGNIYSESQEEEEELTPDFLDKTSEHGVSNNNQWEKKKEGRCSSDTVEAGGYRAGWVGRSKASGKRLDLG